MLGIAERKLKAKAVALGVLGALLAGCATDSATSSDSGTAGEDETLEEATAGDDRTAGDAEFTLSVASNLPENQTASQAMLHWADEVGAATDGRVAFEFFWSESLLGTTEIAPGVADGRADAGYFVPAYHPDQLPISVGLPGIIYETTDVYASTAAFAQLYKDNDAVREEWENMGLHLLNVYPTSPNIISSTVPIESVDDIEPLNLRASTTIIQALEAIGAEVSSIPYPEVFESLQRGVVDGVSGTSLDIEVNAGHHEVAPHFVDPQQGSYAITTTMISADVWESLPDDLRDIIQGVSDDLLDTSIELLMEAEDAACTELLESGGSVTVLPDEEVEEWQAALGDQLEEDFVDSFGEGGRELLDEYFGLVADIEASSPYDATGMQRCAESTG